MGGGGVWGGSGWGFQGGGVRVDVNEELKFIETIHKKKIGEGGEGVFGFGGGGGVRVGGRFRGWGSGWM